MAKYLILVFIIFSTLVSCRKQFVDLGWVSFEKDDLVRKRGHTWSYKPSENLNIYFEEGLEIDKSETVDDIEDAYEDVVEYFNDEEPEEPINLFLLNDAQSMRKIAGGDYMIKQFYTERVILIKARGMQEDDYEMALSGFIATEKWGTTADWVLAGYSYYISVFKDENNDLEKKVLEINQANGEVGILELVNDFSNVDPAITYPVLGSFIKHIIETKGISILELIWKDTTFITDEKLLEWQTEWKEGLKEAQSDH